MDTVGATATVTAWGGVIGGTIAGPHPLQMWAWIVAIAAGAVSVAIGIVRLYYILRNEK